MHYDFKIEYEKEKENVVTNVLSRREETNEEIEGKIEVNVKQLVALSLPLPNWLEAIKEKVESSMEIQQILKKLEKVKLWYHGKIRMG